MPLQQAAPPDWEAEISAAGELLLNGWGFNWYRAENLLRADDLLIRNHADSLLGDAEGAVQRAIAAYRERYLPPPSRERPVPEPAHLAAVRAAKAMLASLEEVRTRLRGACLPPDDKIWRRHREGVELLAALGRCDAGLVGVARAVRDEAFSVRAADLEAAPARLGALIEHLTVLLDRRQKMLAPPV